VTASRHSRRRCATACCSAGCKPRAPTATKGSRTVCYLSAEFLIGPQLGNNLINLGIFDNARQAMRELGLDLEMLLDQEEEPGLGNGGLGSLAACYLDSLATLEIPAIGYGIRYEFGIFTQAIRDGWQVELTDKWLRAGSPWLIHRPNIAFEVKIGGHTEHQYEATAVAACACSGFPARSCAAPPGTCRCSAMG
jgi:glucan phosphorylase